VAGTEPQKANGPDCSGPLVVKSKWLLNYFFFAAAFFLAGAFFLAAAFFFAFFIE
jgi:hypothetical protein